MIRRILAASAAYGYSAVVLVSLLYGYQHIEYIWYIFAALVVLFCVAWVGVVRLSRFTLEYAVKGASPLMLLVSGLAFFVLADSDVLRVVQVVLLTGGIFFILRALYFFFWHSVKYQPHSLQTQIKYINVVTIFFTATFLYALEIFLNVPLWMTALIQFVLLASFFLQHVYIQRLLKQERVSALIGAFLLTQVFVSVAFLPFLVYVKGLLYMLVYFVVLELYEASLRSFWKRSFVVTLVSILLIVGIVVLATTPWY